MSKWTSHVVDLGQTGDGVARAVRGGEVLELSAPMAREVGGTLNVGVRLFRATGAETWELTTILTRQ